jgi:hypothetical protein
MFVLTEQQIDSAAVVVGVYTSMQSAKSAAGCRWLQGGLLREWFPDGLKWEAEADYDVPGPTATCPIAYVAKTDTFTIRIAERPVDQLIPNVMRP